MSVFYFNCKTKNKKTMSHDKPNNISNNNNSNAFISKLTLQNTHYNTGLHTTRQQ